MSLEALTSAVRRAPHAEIGFLLVAKPTWTRAPAIIGVAWCRRTWCHHIVLDFLAAHPATLGSEKGYAGIGTALIYLVAEVAGKVGAPLVWGEATASSPTRPVPKCAPSLPCAHAPPADPRHERERQRTCPKHRFRLDPRTVGRRGPIHGHGRKPAQVWFAALTGQAEASQGQGWKTRSGSSGFRARTREKPGVPPCPLRLCVQGRKSASRRSHSPPAFPSPRSISRPRGTEGSAQPADPIEARNARARLDAPVDLRASGHIVLRPSGLRARGGSTRMARPPLFPVANDRDER